MNAIREILAVDSLSVESLISCMELVKEEGNVVVIKFDGERTEKQYTVFITFPSSKREMIRADEPTLKSALLKVLTAYTKEN